MKRLLAIVVLLLAGKAGAASLSLPVFERVTLDNGVVLLLSEKHDVPLVGMQATLKGGAITDPADRNGLASLFAAVLTKGAGDRDAAAFAEAAAAVGGNIHAGAGAESITITADFLSRDTELMLELVADMLLQPALDAGELARERQRSIDLLRAARGSDPSPLLATYGNAFLFGEHPYGRPDGGSESTLANITHEDLLAYYDEQVGADRLIVAIAGDFDSTAMRARLERVFGGWRPAAQPLPEVQPPERQKGRRVLLVDKPGATQTYFVIGNTGIAIDYPRRAEANLANTVFGGRFTSMLMTQMRVKAGLTYGAGSVLERRAVPGSVMIRSFTETAKTTEAIDLALEVLARLHQSGLDDEAIASARNYIMGQFPPTLETATALAGMLAFLELYGLDRSYIDEYGAALEAATPVSVSNAIAEVYPQPGNLVFVLIGDAAAIRDAVAKYGPVTELAITEPRFSP